MQFLNTQCWLQAHTHSDKKNKYSASQYTKRGCMALKKILIRKIKFITREAFQKVINLLGVISYPDLFGFRVDSFSVTTGYEQNNSSAGASRCMVHFFDTARLRSQNPLCRLWRTWTYNNKYSFLFLNMDKVL